MRKTANVHYWDINIYLNKIVLEYNIKVCFHLVEEEMFDPGVRGRRKMLWREFSMVYMFLPLLVVEPLGVSLTF